MLFFSCHSSKYLIQKTCVLLQILSALISFLIRLRENVRSMRREGLVIGISRDGQSSLNVAYKILVLRRGNALCWHVCTIALFGVNIESDTKARVLG